MRKRLVQVAFIAVAWFLAMSDVAWAVPAIYVAPDLSGSVVDAKTRQPIDAVIQAAWVMRAGEGTPKAPEHKTQRLYVRQVHSGPGGRFEVPGGIAPIGPGWKPIPGQAPIVRIYAKGYQRLVIENRVKAKDAKRSPSTPADAATPGKWGHEGAVLALKPLPDTQDALAKELARWKKDLESEIKQSPAVDRHEAIRKQEKLLFLFDEQCKTLPDAKRKGLCYAADSELGVYLAQAMAERSKFLIIEERNGEITKHPIEFMPAPAPIGMTPGMTYGSGSSPTKANLPAPGVTEPVPTKNQ